MNFSSCAFLSAFTFPLLLTAILNTSTSGLRLATTGTRQTIRSNQFYFRRVTCDRLDRLSHLTAQSAVAFLIAQDRSILDLDLEIKGIQTIVFIHNDTEICASLWKFH